jgi:aquaporin Z
MFPKLYHFIIIKTLKRRVKFMNGNIKKDAAELIGTFVLTFMGCGSAVFLGCAPAGGHLAVALAFGLSIVAMAYVIGGVSGCHINPAITLGVFLSGRMNGKDAGMYMLFQFVGATIGSAIIFALVSTGSYAGVTTTGSNGFADGAMLQAIIAEVVFTFIFVLVVLGSTDSKKGAGNLAGLAIGLTLVLIHIVCIPITGTSVNPARSFGPALFAGGAALSQLVVFIVAPFVGGALAAFCWKTLDN